MAVTAYDATHLNDSQISQLENLTNQWNSASTQAEKDAIHAQANAIRGYSTDASGNYNGLDMWSPSSFVDQAETFVKESNAVAQANAQAQYEFNSAEAQKARDWSEYMSSTAHQREVEDLIKAGLNPILSVGGPGASSGQSSAASGSVANNNESMNSVFGAYLGSLIQSATAINQSTISAKAQEDVASKYTYMDYLIHDQFPSNVWQAFGPELSDLIDAGTQYFKGNSGQTVNKLKEARDAWNSFDQKANNFITTVKDYFTKGIDQAKRHQNTIKDPGYKKSNGAGSGGRGK